MFGRFYFDSDNKLTRKIHLLFEIGVVVAFKSMLAVIFQLCFLTVFLFSHL